MDDIDEDEAQVGLEGPSWTGQHVPTVRVLPHEKGLTARISYAASSWTKGEAWVHLQRNPPTVDHEGKRFRPNFEVFKHNPYRKDHDEATWSWLVSKWVDLPIPPVSRYVQMLDDDWI